MITNATPLSLTAVTATPNFWHEGAAVGRSVFERSPAGNDVVATIFIRFFWHERAAFGRSTGNDVSGH